MTREEMLERQREYQRKYRAENPEKFKEYSKKYREAHPEKHRTYARKWAARKRVQEMDFIPKEPGSINRDLVMRLYENRNSPLGISVTMKIPVEDVERVIKEEHARRKAVMEGLKDD